MELLCLYLLQELHRICVHMKCLKRQGYENNNNKLVKNTRIIEG